MFLRAWRGIAAFSGDARFGTWLFRITVNEAKRRLGRNAVRARIGALDVDGAPEPPDLRAEPHLRLVQSDLRARVTKAIRSLPLKYRAPLVLRDIEGLSTAEAAAILGLGEAAFKSRLHRARAAVRDAVADQLDGAT